MGRPPNSPDLGPVKCLWSVLYKLVWSVEALPCDLQDVKDLLLTSWCQIPQQGSWLSRQHKPDWYVWDSHCRHPFKRQQLWQDLFYGRFIFLVNHTRKYMKNSSVSRVQSASKWFETLCVKGNMQHIPLAACSSPFPRFISEASIDGLSVAVKNKLRCHSPRFRLSETSFKILKCCFDFLQSSKKS